MTCEKCLHYEVCEDKLFKNTDKACEKHFISKSRIAEMEKEIERLTAVEEVHRQQNGELRKEVDRLSQVALYNEGVTKMKIAEAIKGYATRACFKIRCKYGILNPYISDVIEDIAQIAKEMGVEL